MKPTTTNLREERNAIVLSPSICNLLWEGKSDMIVLPLHKKDIVDTPLYLLDHDQAYGIIRLNAIKKLHVTEFSENRSRHNISEEMRQKWWPDKAVLFTYNVEQMQKFSSPKTVLLSSYDQFINGFEFKDDVDTEVLETVKNTRSNTLSGSMEILKQNVSDVKNYAILMSGYDTPKFKLFEDKLNFPYSLTKRFVGEQLFLYKFSDVVKVLNCVMEDVSAQYPLLTEQAKYVSKDDFVLFGDYVDNKFRVFDSPFVQNDLSNQDWQYRMSAIQSMDSTPNIQKPYVIIINSERDLEQCKLLYESDIILQELNQPFGHGLIVEALAENIKSENFFGNWSPTMAYYLGFLTTDGYLDNKTNRIEIGSEDSDVIKTFMSSLGATSGVQRRGKNYIFRAKSQVMATDLRKLGMDKKKPGRTTHTKVPSAYVSAFLRGVFDADGTIDSERKKIQIDNNNTGLMNWVHAKLKSVGGDSVKKYTYGNGMTKVAILEGSIKKVLSYLYKGGGPAVSRKKAIADKM